MKEGERPTASPRGFKIGAGGRKMRGMQRGLEREGGTLSEVRGDESSGR
jgi:hypothetical protein